VTNWDGTNPRSYSDYGNRFMFQGRKWLSELGIYDFRNRMYDPSIGRFLQMDPLGFDGGDVNAFKQQKASL
jgi:RHS repeat-associated protein